MIELLVSFLLAAGSPAPLRCAVRQAEAPYACVLWYDPETNRYFDRYGNEQQPPWGQ